MTGNSEILYHVSKGVGWIKFNRSHALNALSFEMIESLYKVLQKWKNDDCVAIICIEGEGDKAFCAGGDVRALYDLRDSNVEEYALKFFSMEYRMNMTMHTYPKPILAYINGIVMGGGVGVSMGASHRIITEKTKWAMPEMNIGLYPDVGGSYFLTRMPGYVGRYLALTSVTIGPVDVLYAGAADYFIDSRAWGDVKAVIEGMTWIKDSAELQLNVLLAVSQQVISSKNFQMNLLNESTLALTEEKITEHFALERIEDIISRLEASAENGDLWAKETLDILLEKSPTSLKVTLQQLIKGEKKNLFDCFMMELEMSMNFMKSHDFYEGVRAVLVDKDRMPRWKPKTLSDVAEEDISAFFTYRWKNGQNPLEEFSSMF
ncbi:enoyl-CoA hydratase/isomerase family protein [Geosporobacter ferrireducens]|uniref:3-hydroxyisobutyryl-CoA hydrolase n=1 Tax=Geosporobacter ferrireducens TaxID=1424294 RepID=A0A1D8GNT0_9FIRM|nr:enoyl-CoA hydratase/isomerase family protein [Geosporobacter ferrireducens]AOT72578.1 hypothetical protein Gferi_25295 [Geosporobacter ferrireducens]MTI54974.1 enoyl-CoA hydratase/isomerase family protein [Geosporobacter ferrireducens]